MIIFGRDKSQKIGASASKIQDFFNTVHKYLAESGEMLCKIISGLGWKAACPLFSHHLSRSFGSLCSLFSIPLNSLIMFPVLVPKRKQKGKQKNKPVSSLTSTCSLSDI